MATINSTIAIIVLNVNRLNNPIKKAEVIRLDLKIHMLSIGDAF